MEGNSLLNSLVKYPSGVPHSRQSGAFTTWGKSTPLSVWALTWYSYILKPYWGQSRYSFWLWIHSFIVYSYCLEQPVFSSWVLPRKRFLCVFTKILKLKSAKVFNCVTQIIVVSTRNPSSNWQSFVKEAAIWFVVLYTTVELSSLAV